MKFEKPKNFKKWTKEETQSQIELVRSEIVNMNRRMNNIDSEIGVLRREKITIANKIGNKNKYITQLVNQLEEPGNTKV